MGAFLADMQLLNKFNKGFWFLLYVIDTYTRKQWYRKVLNTLELKNPKEQSI